MGPYALLIKDYLSGEYLLDFGTPETRASGDKLIAEQLKLIEEPGMRKSLLEKLERIERGERDLYF